MYKKLYKISLILLWLWGENMIEGNAHSPNNHSVKIDFIENKGQWEKEAKYRTSLGASALFVTDGGFVYNLVNEQDLNKFHDLYYHDNAQIDDVFNIRYHAYKVSYLNANKNISYTTNKKQNYYHNYILGNDESQWVGHVGIYEEITQKNIYDGVDVVMKSSEHGNLKYDFIVHPNADPRIIQLQYDGVSPQITAEGNILIKTSVNEMVEKAPYTYQIVNGSLVEVTSRYVLKGNVLSFEILGAYNTNLPLVIDPDLIYATFSGGNDAANYAHSTTYDRDGNTYTAALCYGGGWPTTRGAYMRNYPASNCVGLNKYSPDGSTLIYSTFLGGPAPLNSSNSVQPHTIRVNDKGEVFLAGNVNNASLPTTANAYSRAISGANDIYISRLSADGSMLLASTFIGGSGLEALLANATTNQSGLGSSTNAINTTDIVFDLSGNIWVTSNTSSADFPVTANAYQDTLNGSVDAVLFKMDQDLTKIIYGTYIGGNGWDGGIGVEFNSNSNEVGLVGMTSSNDFPTTTGAYKTAAPGGLMDGFVLLVNNETYAMKAVSYLGTDLYDNAMRLAFDCVDNVFVTGRTLGDYPISRDVVGATSGNVYIDKLNPDLSGSLVSSRTGGVSTNIVPSSMMVDYCGNILIATIVSNALQADMPLTDDAFIREPRAFYFAAFEANFTGLIFGSYYGSVAPNGNTTDHYHPGISRIDPNGIIYHSVCASGTSADQWPVTPNAFATTKRNGSTNDNITFKFNFDAVVPRIDRENAYGANDSRTHTVRGCNPAQIHYSRVNANDEPMVFKLQIEGDAVNGVDYEFIADSVVIPPLENNVTLTIKALLTQPRGTKYVVINALAPCSCDGKENIFSSDTVYIYDSLYVDILTPLDTFCPNTTVTIEAEIDSTLAYIWAPDNLIQDQRPLGLTINPTVYATEVFTITASQPNSPSTCPTRTESFIAYVEPTPKLKLDPQYKIVCFQDDDSLDLVLDVLPNTVTYKYQWSPMEYLSYESEPYNRFKAPVGEYKIAVNVSTLVAECVTEDTFYISVVEPFEFESVSPKDTIIRFGSQVLIETKSEAKDFLWLPNKYLDDEKISNPIAKPLESIQYMVIGIDENGCVDTAYVNINVDFNPELMIPSAFSPNNDGLNDEFKIYLHKYEKLERFNVFNRYGALVFETTNINKGWDGNIKGEPAAQDVYMYQIRIVYPDGTPKEYKGDVVLLR